MIAYDWRGFHCTVHVTAAQITFHDCLQRGHLLLPLAADLVDGFLLGVFRHGGHSFDGLYLGTGLSQLVLDGAQLHLGALQRSSLPLQLLWGGARQIKDDMIDRGACESEKKKKEKENQEKGGRKTQEPKVQHCEDG